MDVCRWYRENDERLHRQRLGLGLVALIVQYRRGI